MVDTSENRLHRAIDLVYQAVADPACWPDAARALSALLGAQRSSLVVPTAPGRFENLLARNDAPELARAYSTHFHTVDPYRADEAADRPRLVGVPGPHTKLGQAVISEHDLIRTEFYNDYARHLGAHHMVGAAMGDANPIPLAIFREPGREAFGVEQERLLRLFVPHLQRALKLSRALRSAQWMAAAGAGMLDAVRVAAVVVDAAATVQFINAAAEQAVTAGAGLRFSTPSERLGAAPVLRAQHRADQMLLDRLITDVATCGGPGGAMQVRLPLGRGGAAGRLAIMVSPLPSRLAGRERGIEPGVALIVIRSTAAPSASSAGLLRDLFGLSAAEAGVAAMLVGGTSFEQVARQRQVGLETVRSQARNVLRKTGSSSLREFERLVALLTGG